MLSIQPEIAGPKAVAKLRGVLVIAEAAGRSGSVTTAMTYEDLAGASIACISARMDNVVSASAAVGMKGVSIKKRFAGRWLNTITFTSPNRFASGAESNCDTAVSKPSRKK